MIEDLAMMAAALFVAGACACRIDALTWWRNPLLMALHVGCGTAAAWAFTSTVSAGPCWRDAAILAGAMVLLVATYRHIPQHSCK